jgi:hypothetical protein
MPNSGLSLSWVFSGITWTVSEVVLAGVVSFWFVLSVLSQLSALGQIKESFSLFQKKDMFALIPIWTFFAPIPGTFDYHLLYRDRLHGGLTTQWTEVPLGRAVPVVRALWNPASLQIKAMLDIMYLFREEGLELNRLTKGVECEPAVLHISSIAYLSLLNFISSLPRFSVYESTQFLVMKGYGALETREPEVVFLSSFHDL